MTPRGLLRDRYHVPRLSRRRDCLVIYCSTLILHHLYHHHLWHTFFFLIFEWSDVFSAHTTSEPVGWLARYALSRLGLAWRAWIVLGKKLLAFFFSFCPETVINIFWNGSSVARKKRSKPKFCARMLGEVYVRHGLCAVPTFVVPKLWASSRLLPFFVWAGGRERERIEYFYACPCELPRKEKIL